MNVIKNNKDLVALKRGMNFKNYFNKNKYFFNELYKNKTLPKHEIVSVVKQILDYDPRDDQDEKIKSIAQEFVKDHHELFDDDQNMTENVSKNDDENRVKNLSENDDKNLSKIMMNKT